MDAAPAHHFLRGIRSDAPVIVPIVRRRSDLAASIEFCRAIAPGSSILLPLPPDRGPGAGEAGQRVHGAFVTQVALLLEIAATLYDLALVPLVVLGHGEGADIAALLAFEHGVEFAACILLHPAHCPASEAPQSLDGVTVLLCQSAPAGAAGSAGERIARVMTAAGAQVILESVPSRASPGKQETAICRVFLSTLFNPPRLS